LAATSAIAPEATDLPGTARFADDGKLDFRRLMVVIAVLTGTLLEIIDSSIVNVALPDMMGNLGASLDEISWVVTGYILSNVVIIPMTAWLAGRFGRKRYFTSSILLFTVASFFCGFAHTLPELVTFRVIQGLGGGALLSTSQAILVETFPPQRQGSAQAIFGVGVMLGPSLGPTLGGWITSNWTWPWIFYVNVPLGLAAAFLSSRYLQDPEHLRGRRGIRVDYVGIALLIVGVGALQFVLERGERYDWFEDNAIFVLTVTAILALVGFIAYELRCKQPVVDLRVLRHRALAAGCVFGVVMGVGLYGSVFLFPVFTQSLLGWTSWQSGLAILPSSIATALMMTVAGRLVWRIGPRPILWFGIGVFILGLVGMSHWTLESGWDDLFWPQVCRGIGLGAMFVPVSSVTLGSLPSREVQQGAGLYNLFRQLGGSFGIATLTTVLHHSHAIHHAYLSERVAMLDPETTLRLSQLTHGFQQRGLDAVRAHDAALSTLSSALHGQAAILSFEDCYRMVAVLFLMLVPMVLLLRRPAAQVLPGH
jgi:MFS transporter, DHA2 family, multidrug resistance protein